MYSCTNVWRTGTLADCSETLGGTCQAAEPLPQLAPGILLCSVFWTGGTLLHTGPHPTCVLPLVCPNLQHLLWLLVCMLRAFPLRSHHDIVWRPVARDTSQCVAPRFTLLILSCLHLWLLATPNFAVMGGLFVCLAVTHWEGSSSGSPCCVCPCDSTF